MHRKPVKVLVWDENASDVPTNTYPENIRGAIAAGLTELGGDTVEIRTACLDDPYQGLPGLALNESEVLVWWGHRRHDEVTDETAARIVEHVREHGLGFIALHSAHYSKPFTRLLKCTGDLKGGWSDAEQPEEVHVCAPRHPIAHGVPSFTLAQEEMYGGPFDVPPPDVVVFQSWFPVAREYFPSGLCWTVGAGIDPHFHSGPGHGVGQGKGVGRVFYFRPGHETVLTYFNQDVRQILLNAVRWAAKRT
jgi:trehalose utilization protein